MKLRQVVYIVSDINKALHFEWVAKQVNRERFQLTFILIGNPDTALATALKQIGVKTIVYPTPTKLQLPGLIFKIRSKLIALQADVVHTHLLLANQVGLTAAWLARVPIRVFTRHHALVHHLEHRKGLWFDRWFAFVATHIVAISKSIEEILIKREGVNPKKVRIIHHGFDLDYFTQVSDERIVLLKNKWGIANSHYPVVGVVARYQHWKGIQYIVPAFEKLLTDYPNALLLLANAHGAYEPTIKSLLRALPPQSYREMVFEEDLAALYQLMNIYVHTPISSEHEAFGQTYIEALAASVPSVFTLSGVASEFIYPGAQALVVPFQDSTAIEEACKRILADKNLSTTLQAKGLQAVQQFRLQIMIAELEKLYAS